MTCNDCKWFSYYLGGTCLGWADMGKTNADAEVGSCSRFCLKNNKEPRYIPNYKEEYSEYDRQFSKYDSDKGE